MLALRDGALETWIEGIARKECDELGQVLVLWVGAVLVDDGLEARDAADGLSGSGSALVLAADLEK